MPGKTKLQEYEEAVARIYGMREQWRRLIEASPDAFWNAQSQKCFDETVVGLMFQFIDLAAAARIADTERIAELESRVRALELQIMVQAPTGRS